MNHRRQIQFLYTNVGRGHPFYLDGIAEAMIREGGTRLVRKSIDLPKQATGISKLVWRGVQSIYRAGASDGLIGRAYSQLRKGSDYNRKSLPLKLAGRSIVTEMYRYRDDRIVAAHPVVIGILSGRPGLIYQHGELVAPNEALVLGADHVLVPMQETAERFIEAGCNKDRIVVTGLCVEPALVRQAEDSFLLRLSRLESDQPLTGALFSSGAEPKTHIRRLGLIAQSALDSNHRLIVVTQTGGRLDRAVTKLALDLGVIPAIISGKGEIPYELPRLTIVRGGNRREEDRLVAQLYPSFDYLVIPPHERTNWAVGLGLPTFWLTPCYGSFAPLNHELLLKHQVGHPILTEYDAINLGHRINELRHAGELAAFARNGWGRYPINGFKTIAQWLTGPA